MGKSAQRRPVYIGLHSAYEIRRAHAALFAVLLFMFAQGLNAKSL